MIFDVDYIPSENVFGRYFYEGLRPLIKLWIIKKGQELDIWNNLIKKTTRAEAKTKIQGNQNLNQCYPQSNCPIYTTISKNPTMQDCQNTIFVFIKDI